MADAIEFGLLALCLMLRVQSTDSGRYFVATTSAEKTPCDFDINQCMDGTCKQTELVNGRNFLCACPPKKTGTLCEATIADCEVCEIKMECTGFDDGTAFCICYKYSDKYKNYKTPSICYFHNKKKNDKQGMCMKGNHGCTPGQECVYYNEVVCQCPVGNTRGQNCEEDYKLDVPGDQHSCMDTINGPLCMCKLYGPYNDEYGFCKAKIMVETLVDALNDTGPCSFDRNKCRYGTCVQTGDDSFTCTCVNSYTGKYCHIKRPLCDECEADQRTECLGLPDGTAFCICNEYIEQVYQAPSVCQFRAFRKTRQKYCKNGDHGCQRGEQCINYSYNGPVVEVCQCAAGVSRGKNCLQGYEYLDENDIKSGKYECLNTENRGPVCLCDKYYGKLGFCTLKIYSHGALVDAEGSGTACDEENNRCNEGTCMETEKYKHWDYICACSKGHTGELCHYEMHRCELCTKEEIVECIGLADQTAVCICLMMINPRKHGLKPQICYTEKAKPHRQKQCQSGPHDCDAGQQCVNYVQHEFKMLMLCQCPAGKLRGKQCKEEYALTDAGKDACVDTGTDGPICLCFDDHFKYEFCKPKLKVTAKESRTDRSSSTKGSCQASANLCKKGKCVETTEKSGWTYACSCPVGSTGNLCQKDMESCDKCSEDARRDCIGFRDGTAVCICVQFEQENLAVEPAICFYKKFKKHRQTVCQHGQHTCDIGQECINYALTESDLQITCLCLIERKRGRSCDEEYRVVTPGGEFDCVDTGGHGSLCMCEHYGHGVDKYGFCKLDALT